MLSCADLGAGQPAWWWLVAWRVPLRFLVGARRTRSGFILLVQVPLSRAMQRGRGGPTAPHDGPERCV